MEAKTIEEANTIEEEIYKDLAEKIPYTKREYIDNWRYFSMLSSIVTTLRNVLGNTAFIPARAAKNSVGAIIERNVNKAYKKQGKFPIERTKMVNRTRFLNKFYYEYKANKNFAKELFDKEGKDFMSGGKYNIMSEIDKYRKKSPIKLLDKVMTKNSDLLEKTDRIFFKEAFADSFAQYFTVNGLTPEMFKNPESFGFNSEYAATNFNEKYNRAITYAVKEAKKATYRDESAFASMLTRLSKKNLVSYIGVEGLIPFKKTTVNVFKRAIEYSPGGLMKGIGDVITKVPTGYLDATEAIDEIACGFSGSMVVMLGAFLASAGLITGSGEEEEKLRSIDSSNGLKSYSLNVAGYSYPLSWAAPTAIPLFVGVEAYNSLNDGFDKYSFKDIGEAMMRIIDPLFEMSFVTTLTDAVTSMAYAPADQRFSTLVSEVAANYASQYVPNIARPFVTLTDGTKRGYYTDKNSPLPDSVQGIIQGAKMKIPGLSQTLEPSLDVWGREQTETSMPIKILNAFGPATATKQINDPVNEALRDLYSLTGEIDVLPSKPQKYSEVNGKRKDYTGPEYTTATRLKGQTAYNSIRDVMNSNTYNSMTPEEKRGVIKDIYEYSNAITRDELDDRYEVESWVTKVNNGVKETGMSAGEIMLYRDMINGITKGDKVAGKSKAELQDELIHNLNISTNSKNWLSKNFVTRGTFIPDNETVVDHSSHENFVISQMSQSAQKLYNNYAWQFVDENEYTKIYEALKDGDSDEKKSRLLNMGYPRDFVNRIVDLKNNPEKLGE